MIVVRPDGWILDTQEESIRQVFEITDAGRSGSRRPKQKYDCTVRALATVADVSYDEAYDYLAAHRGRKSYKGVHFPARASDDWAMGLLFKWRAFPAVKGQKRITIVEFTQRFNKGKWILKQAGHVLAVVNGIAYDTHPHYGRCVYGSWEVTNSDGSNYCG